MGDRLIVYCHGILAPSYWHGVDEGPIEDIHWFLARRVELLHVYIVTYTYTYVSLPGTLACDIRPRA